MHRTLKAPKSTLSKEKPDLKDIKTAKKTLSTDKIKKTDKKLYSRKNRSAFNYPLWNLLVLLIAGLAFSLGSLFMLGISTREAKQKAGQEYPNFTQVKNVKIGDKLYIQKDASLAADFITSIEKIFNPVQVFNLSVDNTQTYFAESLAVHNKGDIDPYGEINPNNVTALNDMDRYDFEFYVPSDPVCGDSDGKVGPDTDDIKADKFSGYCGTSGDRGCESSGWVYGGSADRSANPNHKIAYTVKNMNCVDGSNTGNWTAPKSIECPAPWGGLSASTVSVGADITFKIQTSLSGDIDSSKIGPTRRLHDTSYGEDNKIVWKEGSGATNYGNQYLHDCTANLGSNPLTFTCKAPTTAGSYAAVFSTKYNCDVNFWYTVSNPALSIGGIVVNSNNNTAISNYEITITDGNGKSQTVKTGSNGRFSSTSNYFSTGPQYAVRPSLTLPAGYTGKAKTTNSSTSYNNSSNQNYPTSWGSGSYEYQNSTGANLGCGTNCDFTIEPSTTYSCQNLSGITTTNATLCENDTSTLTANTNYSVVDTCTATKCEYKCNTGYHKAGTACVENVCNPDFSIANTTICSTTLLPSTNLAGYTYVNTCNNIPCTFTCKSGYIWNSTSSSCGTTTTAPSCTVTPSSTTGPTGTTFTYTGTASGGNGSYAYAWAGSIDSSSTTNTATGTYNTAGTYTAYLTVTSNGQNAGCEASVTVTPPTTYSCQNLGSINIANATLCPDDTTGLTANTNYSVKDTCTATKCEYKCNSGYHDAGTVCVADTTTYSCQGTIPSNAHACNSTTPSSNTNYSYVSSCSTTACTYTCDGGYTWNSSACNAATYSCLGSVPANATRCNTNLPTGSDTYFSVVSSCGTTACTFRCNSGYSWDGDSCETSIVYVNITGRVHDVYNTSIGISGVQLTIDVAGIGGGTFFATTNSTGNFSKTIELPTASNYFDVIVSSSTSPDSNYAWPPLTPDKATRYTMQQWGNGDCVNEGGCNFGAYPKPKADCQLRTGSNAYADEISISPNTTVDFRNNLFNPLSANYSNTLSYGDGSANFSGSITAALNSHTYANAGPFTPRLTTMLNYATWNDIKYSASAINTCTIGAIADYTVSGSVKNESGTGIQGITVIVNDGTDHNIVTDSNGAYSVSIGGGRTYSVSISGNAASTSCGNENGLIETINGIYYMKPILTTNSVMPNQMSYINQQQDNTGCAGSGGCNFVYYRSPYAQINEDEDLRSGSVLTFNWLDTATNYAPNTALAEKKIEFNVNNISESIITSPSNPISYDFRDLFGFAKLSTKRNFGSDHYLEYCHKAIVVFAPASSSWWQVGSGNVFSNYTPGSGGTTAIKSEVPATESFFSGGGTATWNMGEINVSENIGSDAVALDSGAYGGKTYDYRYWESKLADYTIDMSLTGNTLDLNDITITDPQTEGIYRVIPQPEGLLNIIATAAIDGKQIVILHDGNVNITSDITTVPGSDAIIILIASGSIAFNNNAGDNTDNYIHGIYIGDTINTGNYANKLSIKGSLIGWTGVYLQRSYASASEPAELFIQNVEMINALKSTTGPLKAFKSYRYTWEEVAP